MSSALSVLTLVIAFLSVASMPVFAALPTNAELALLGTALGDHKGEYNYRNKPRHKSSRDALCTDDTHKAAAIFAYFSGFSTKQNKNVDIVRLARFQCFAAFPEKQRFGLDMTGSPAVNLPGYGPGHARLLKQFYQRFENGGITSWADVLTLSGRSIRGNTGSWSNGGCMGIAPIVGIIDNNPYIGEEEFVRLVEQTVQVSHNHSHAIAAAVAIALAARSSILYRNLDAATRPSHHDFALATIDTIGLYVTDNDFLKCLRVVQRYIGSNSHNDVISELNSLLPAVGNSARGSRHNLTGRQRLRDTWAPNSAAAVLHFFFTNTGSQQELLQLVERHTEDQDTIGAMLMALSALREGGFRGNEFDASELQSLLDYFPQWVRINRNASDYLVRDTSDTVATADTCACAGACACAGRICRDSLHDSPF